MQLGTAVQAAATAWPSDLALMDVTKTEDNMEANASVFWKKKHVMFKWVYFLFKTQVLS